MFRLTFVFNEIFRGRYEEPVRLNGIGIERSLIAAGKDVSELERFELPSKARKSSLLELRLTGLITEVVLDAVAYFISFSGILPLAYTSRTASKNFMNSWARLFCPLCS